MGLESDHYSSSSQLIYSLVGITGLCSIRYPFEGRTLLTLTVLRPDMSFHWDNGGGLSL